MIRNAHEIPNDIIFRIDENLYDSPNVLLQESTKNIKFSQGRTFQSYINEFCGMVGLSSSKLNFIIDTNKRAPDPKQKVMSNCVLIVHHSPSFSKLPNKSLKPAFKLLLSEGLFSDVIIHVEDDEIPAHKCILCTQSKIFNNIINYSDSKNNQDDKYARETQTGDQDSEDEELKTPDENVPEFRPMRESSKRRLLDFIPSIRKFSNRKHSF